MIAIELKQVKKNPSICGCCGHPKVEEEVSFVKLFFLEAETDSDQEELGYGFPVEFEHDYPIIICEKCLKKHLPETTIIEEKEKVQFT